MYTPSPRIVHCLVVVWALAAGVPAEADWSRKQNRRVDNLEERLERLEKSTAEVNQSVRALTNEVRQVQNMIDSGTIISVLERLDLMQNEAAELRELTEQTGYSQERMQSRLREIIIDFDRRIQELRTLIEGSQRAGVGTGAVSVAPAGAYTAAPLSQAPTGSYAGAPPGGAAGDGDGSAIPDASSVDTAASTGLGDDGVNTATNPSVGSELTDTPAPELASNAGTATDSMVSDAASVALAAVASDALATAESVGQLDGTEPTPDSFNGDEAREGAATAIDRAKNDELSDELGSFGMSARFSAAPLVAPDEIVEADRLADSDSATPSGQANAIGDDASVSKEKQTTAPSAESVAIVQTPPAVAPRKEPATQAKPAKPKSDKQALAKREYAKALRMFSQRQYKGALDIFENLYRQHSEFTQLAGDSIYWAGDCHYNLNQLHDALALFRRLESQYPGHRKSSDSRLKMGYVLHSLGEFQESARVLSSLLEDEREDISRLAAARLRRVELDIRLRSR